MAHGLLVFAFIYQIIEAKKEDGFSLKETGLYSILSLIPFGSFYTDKLLAKKMTIA
jgi:integral membrane protein